jgi:uncharacterized YigZ family protein
MPEKILQYYVPRGKIRITFTERGSKFIADLAPAAGITAAREHLEIIRTEFTDATHHPHAFRIGFGSNLTERSSDDHEPAGTAGAPMLQNLQGNNVSDVSLVAIRYFGGTKLGIGGLTRAYRNCARLSLKTAELILREPLEKYYLCFKYEEIGPVTRFVEGLGGRILAADYSDTVKMTVEIPLRSARELKEGFVSVCRGGGSCSVY